MVDAGDLHEVEAAHEAQREVHVGGLHERHRDCPDARQLVCERPQSDAPQPSQLHTDQGQNSQHEMWLSGLEVFVLFSITQRT